MYVAQFHTYVVFRVKCVEKRRFDQEKRRCYVTVKAGGDLMQIEKSETILPYIEWRVYASRIYSPRDGGR